MPPISTTGGEHSNLAIARGTLTEEERYMINDHIIQTIPGMLEMLPFPRHLRRCRQIAGATTSGSMALATHASYRVSG